MRDEIVAIDLETTGLDVTNDDIIEVGAVRLREGEVIAEYSTMVKPSIPIPQQTTYITGIAQTDVNNAPSIDKVLPQISDFIGDSPVLAHNINLDIGFLRDRYGILKTNHTIDTYDLATILLPSAPRYNLNSLTQQVGINLEHAHRALDDARAAGLLYWELWERILQLPHTILQEISRNARDLEWGSSIVFTEALRQSTTASRDQVKLDSMALFSPMIEQLAPLQPNPTKPLEPNQSSEILDDASAFQQHNPHYVPREQQKTMAEAISEAFNNREHLILEADTGTGKSLAYLLPAVLWAVQNNERVVISTNTLNLQDQLLNNDIPLLQESTGIDFKAVVMKGRDNYLCPRRLSATRRRQVTSVDELRTLAKILVWLSQSRSGDRSEINLHGAAERNVWSRMSAQDEGCSLRRCHLAMNGACPFYKAQQAAEAAHILIVNHALLIADAKSENRVLPDYRYLIVDEAHQLEDAVTHSLTFQLDEPTLQRRINSLGTPNRGLFGEIMSSLNGKISQRDYQRLETFIQSVSEAIRAMEAHIKQVFNSIYAYMYELQGKRPSDFLTLTRIDDRLRGKPGFAHIQSHWRTLDEFFEVVSDSMQRLTKALARHRQSSVPNIEDLIDSTETASYYLKQIRDELNHFIIEPQSGQIYWFTLGQGSDTPRLYSAPVHIGNLAERFLWQDKHSVILTGATLRTHQNFEHIQQRLFAETARTLQIPPVFNYRESTLLYLPDDIPEPTNRQAYQKAVERGIIDLAAALDGRVLVLFTSYTQLRQTAQAITSRLMLGNIVVYDQSDGTSREALLEGFKSADKAVLLGTRSFWEGIDIPGDSLSAVVIVRLPFAVPSDPIFAARSETYDNSFVEYAVPDAILRFRQGFGRLIRTPTDKGVITVFDSRIISKKYGANFLEALPECTTQTGTLENLSQAAVDWLNGETS